MISLRRIGTRKNFSSWREGFESARGHKRQTASISYVRTVTVASGWLAIDANVYVAQFTKEEFSAQAEKVFRFGAALVAPDFIGIEVASAFLKKVRRRAMTLTDATSALDGLRRRVRLEASAGLWSVALTYARNHNLSAYDALYVSLALREQCQLVTADKEIADVLRRESPATLVWLGDFPGV
jgi:predicted nucleic acid-binding protein